MSVVWFTVETPLPSGPMRVAVTEQGVLAAAFTARDVAGLPSGPELADPGSDRRAVAVRDRFAAYFAGTRKDLDLPVDWRLTAGPQQAVLRTLHRTVGFGVTITYGKLAERSGVFGDTPEERALAAQAVGSIMGSCPISLLVPCHRVVAADGLGGFGGGPEGMELKRWLLTHEGVLAPTLDWSL